MKMVKSLLLGSAAGLVAVAGAQAADLPVKAKPVQYVKICSLYGDGFWYVPGTDVCLKIGGYVRADYGWNVTGARTPHYGGAAGAQDRSVNAFSYRHRGNINFDVRTQTPYGTLRSFESFHVNFEDGLADSTVTVPRAFIQWAGFTFGHTQSFTDSISIGDGYPSASLHQTQAQSDTGANGTNQIAYTWDAGNGMTLSVGADERRVRSVTNLSAASASVGADPASSRHGAQHPNPWVAFKVNQAWGRFSIAVIGNKNHATNYTGNTTGALAPAMVLTGCPAGAQTGTTQCFYPSDKWGYAVLMGGKFNLPMINPGDSIGFYFNFGVGAVRYSTGSNIAAAGLFGGGNQVAFGHHTDAVYVNGASLEMTSSWTFAGAYEHAWTRSFKTAWYGTYSEVDYSSTVVNNRWFCGGVAGSAGIATAAVNPVGGQACDPSFRYWTVGSVTSWYPTPDLRLAVDVMYTQVDTAMGGQVSLSKAQGLRPTGLYTAKNQGITSVIFRAQRNWPRDE